MSYTITTNKAGEKVYTVLCNETGCKAHFDSKVGKGDAWQTVKADGWFSDSAANHRCVEHKPARATRATKEAKVTKGKVAQTKAEKVTKATKTTKATKPATKPATPFVGGQSIGKLAKSAKKSVR